MEENNEFCLGLESSSTSLFSQLENGCYQALLAAQSTNRNKVYKDKEHPAHVAGTQAYRKVPSMVQQPLPSQNHQAAQLQVLSFSVCLSVPCTI